MKESLKEDLLALECEGNVAKLPTAPLNNYPELKKVLTKATGKYKKNTFVFPSPAQPIIDTLLGGTVVDFKKEFQFFPTPQEMAENMVNQIIWDKGDTVNILEPSAGHGALIDEILKRTTTPCIHAVELSDLNFNVLQNKYKDGSGGLGAIRLIKGDFLEVELDPPYDIIIANPPFNKNQDIDHVRKMYDILDKGGQLISIMSTSWTFSQQKKQVEFREWIEEVEAEVIQNEQGTFKTSGTMVSSVLVIIRK